MVMVLLPGLMVTNMKVNSKRTTLKVTVDTHGLTADNFKDFGRIIR